MRCRSAPQPWSSCQQRLEMDGDTDEAIFALMLLAIMRILNSISGSGSDVDTSVLAREEG